MHEKKEEMYIVKNKDGDFMKRILKMIITGILFFCTAFSIVGCGEETGNGMTEEERIAYENIEKYHAEMIASPECQFNLEYRIANRTRGNQYNFETNEFSYDCPDVNDETLPESRIKVITTQEELEEAFSVFPEIDFEKEMIVVCFCLSEGHSFKWERELRGISLDENNNLSIQVIEKYKETGNTSLPPAPDDCTTWFLVKMDKIEFGSVKYTRIRQNGMHIKTWTYEDN